MNNDGGFGVSIKEYAEQRSKTVQAVYQQIKRKENAAALKGHIFTRRVGNKDVKYLDDVAVSILDEASGSTASVVYPQDLKADLEVAQADLEAAKMQLAYREGEINTLRGLLADKERELRQLAEPHAQIDLLKGQITEIKAERDTVKVERDEYKEKVASAEERAVEANSEAYRAREYVAELEAYLRLPKIVQLFTKKPVLKSREEISHIEEGETNEGKN